jgi:hypothetical protein
MRFLRNRFVRKTHTPTIKDQHHMKKHFASWMSVPAVALLGVVAACSDVSTTAPSAAPEMSSPRAVVYEMTRVLSQGTTDETKVKQATFGDTVVTVFVVGTNTRNDASVGLGFSSRIEFPYQVGSICDPLRSSYGPGTWNDACIPLRRNVTITARTWLNAKGKLQTDFEPALRFVPGLRESVNLTLRDAALTGTRIDYCNDAGVCVDESVSDASVATSLDRSNGFVSRIIKHFSGYTIAAD